MAEPLQIHTIVSTPFQENTYVVWRAGSSEALVIDPGLEPDLILTFLRDQETQEMPAASAENDKGTPSKAKGGFTYRKRSNAAIDARANQMEDLSER